MVIIHYGLYIFNTRVQLKHSFTNIFQYITLVSNILKTIKYITIIKGFNHFLTLFLKHY